MEPSDCRKTPSMDPSTTRIANTPHTRAELGFHQTKARGTCGTTRYKPDGQSETNQPEEKE